MKGFTAPKQVGFLRLVFGSLVTIVLMLSALFVTTIFIPGGGSSESYAACLPFVVAFIVATAAGFICFWGLMFGFSRSWQDLRWLSLYFGILGATAVGKFVQAIVFLGDSHEPAWKLHLIVAIAAVTTFLLCWGLARLMSEMIGRPENTQNPK